MSKNKKSKGKSKSKGEEIRELSVAWDDSLVVPEGARVIGAGDVAAGYFSEDGDKALTIAFVPLFVPLKDVKNLSSINVTFDLTRPPSEAAGLLLPMIRQFSEFVLPSLDEYFRASSDSARSFTEMGDDPTQGVGVSDSAAALAALLKLLEDMTAKCGDPECSCSDGESPVSVEMPETD